MRTNIASRLFVLRWAWQYHLQWSVCQSFSQKIAREICNAASLVQNIHMHTSVYLRSVHLSVACLFFFVCLYRTTITICHPRNLLLCPFSALQTSFRWSHLTPLPSACTGETANVGVSKWVEVTACLHISKATCGISEPQDTWWWCCRVNQTESPFLKIKLNLFLVQQKQSSFPFPSCQRMKSHQWYFLENACGYRVAAEAHSPSTQLEKLVLLLWNA